jgi:hypothetical protein
MFLQELVEYGIQTAQGSAAAAGVGGSGSSVAAAIAAIPVEWLVVVGLLVLVVMFRPRPAVGASSTGWGGMALFAAIGAGVMYWYARTHHLL